MSRDEIKLEYYIRLKTLNYIDLNEALTQQLAKEMAGVHEQLLIHDVVGSEAELSCDFCEEPVKVNRRGTHIICSECGYQKEVT